MINQVIYNSDVPLISKILKKIFVCLNENKECMIMTNSFTFLYLVLLPRENYVSEPPEIKDHEVPFPLQDLKKIAGDTDITDPVFGSLLGEITGERCVRKIAERLEKDVDQIKRYIQHLVYYRLVMMIDVFQFNNIYTLTTSIHSFVADPKMQDEGVEFVVKQEWIDKFGREDLLKLYLGLSKRVTVREFVLEHAELVRKINITKFIQFGLIKKILRRVHEYPIKQRVGELSVITKQNYRLFFSRDLSSSPELEEEKARELNKVLNKFLDGNHSLDEICLHFQKSRAEIVRALESTSIFIVQK